MASPAANLRNLIERAKSHAPIRAAVIAAGQELVLQALQEAVSIGLVEPRLIGDPDAILACARDAGFDIDRASIIAANSETEAARKGVELVRTGEADAVMKGHIHTDIFMRALLDKDRGLRVAGRRVSHVFLVENPKYPKLLAVTDAAINIAPDLNAKAQILQNAVSLCKLLDIETPKAAALSAIEMVNPAITSTLDAACLTLMAKRGQITGVTVDGPLAFDNAISADAAKEKGIVSEVAGDVDILLVPDLVSGNILVKNLVYLAGATVAGTVVGLTAPVVLTSRVDPPAGRLASLALAVLMHHSTLSQPEQLRTREPESAVHCAAQPEDACCPIGV